MGTTRRRWTATLGALVVALILGSAPAPAASAGATPVVGPGDVFTLSNETNGNEVLRLERASDGTLTDAGSFATGGTGNGGGLGSQGALVLNEYGTRLLAVNAGSDDVSVLKVRPTTLKVTDVQPTGGAIPISVTIHHRLVYVLNDGTDTVTGFRLRSGGDLRPIARSTRSLSGTGITPAQVEFSPDGRVLVVTEKDTDTIVTYRVRLNGRLSAPHVQDSEGMTPFGFAFAPDGNLIVSEAFGGAADSSALSSYDVGRRGVLTPISSSVGTTETAACWVVVTGDGAFAYTTNTGSGSVSGYAIEPDGSLTLLDADGVTGTTGASPIDLALTDDDAFLYTLDAGDDQITGSSVGADGSLANVDTFGGLPASSVGLAAS